MTFANGKAAARPTRRQLLQSGAVSLLWSATGCTIGAEPGAQPAPSVAAVAAAPTIDVHCHIFNAIDLPIRNFVRDIVFAGKWPMRAAERILLQPTVDFLSFIMMEGSPDARAEIAVLTARSGEGLAAAAPPAGLMSDPERKKALVVRALDRMRRGERPQAAGIAAAAPAAPARANIDFVDRLARQYHPAATAAPVTGAAVPAGVLSDLAGIFEGIERAKDAVTNDVEWAYRYTLYRYEILRLLSEWPIDGATDVGFFCPALIDYAYWLQEFDTTPLSDQIAVMEQISQTRMRMRQPAAAMHGFVPFDPWRQTAEPATLALLQDAVRNRGFVGIKLYPPMGFRPIGNAALLPKQFPPGLRRLTSQPGASLDAALRQLYDWCVAEDVPIEAHCSFSQFPYADYGERAGPHHWERVLNEYPRLRLNLAHCGGPWDMVEDTRGRPGAARWTLAVMRLLGSGRYPNLYSDFADAAIMLGRTQSETNKARQMTDRMRSLLVLYPQARTRLMYGSDWSLLGREYRSEAYYAQMKGTFCNAIGFNDAERAGFLSGNAARFLGLAADTPGGAPPKTLQRLDAFYRRHGVEPTPLRPFMGQAQTS